MKKSIPLILLLGFTLARVASATTFADDFAAALPNYMYGGWQGPFGDGTAGRLFPTADSTGIYMDATYNGYVWALRSSPEFSDADMTVRFDLPNRDNTDADWFGLWMLAHNPTTPPNGPCTTVCPFVVPESGLWLQFRVGMSQLVVTRFDGGVGVSSTSVPLPPVALNQPHDARAVYHGDSLLVYLDGAQLLSWPAPNVPAGQVGVEVYRVDMIVDRIDILAGPLAPVVTAPAAVSGTPNVLLSFTVTASDPDGDAINSLTAAPLPAGATFTSNATNTSGTFNWTPSDAQTGTYAVTFTAANALTGSATTNVDIGGPDRAPVVTAPATETGCEGALLNFTVSASDPDGDVITSLTASGTAITAGGTFTSNAAHTSGTFAWTPSFTAGGSYAVTFTASNALSGSATTSITVLNGCDRAPVVTAPTTVSGVANTLITFTVLASDPNGDIINSLTASPLPPGATFTSNISHTSGTFTWTPSLSQVGTFNVTFTASNSLSGSATTAITVTSGADRAPVVTAPATETGCSGALLSFTVFASDPDGDVITSLTASGTAITAGGTFTSNAIHTSGTFSWTPTFTDAGSYAVTFTASNALSGSATTAITVGCPDRAPVVTAPATASTSPGSLVTFRVTASDPDGDAITSLTAAGTAITAGGSFIASAGNTSGTFSWTPSLSTCGTFSVTFTASNALSGSATTAITVYCTDRAPVVTAPATASGAANTLITFTVSASDPDGDPIASLTASGTAMTAGASFTAGAGNTRGTFSWTPTLTQTGSYSVTFTASNALSGSATTAITVNNADRCPVLTAPAGESDPEGVNLTFTVSATDPDGDLVALSATGLPLGATFQDHLNMTGTFSWTPDFNAFEAGPMYTVTFHANDNAGCSTVTATTLITVIDVNRAPTAVITAPPQGVVGAPVNMNGALSTDPDGDVLSFAWDFGDGGTAAGVSVSHIYTTDVGSPFTIVLTVTDSHSAGNSATQPITVVPCLPGTVFAVGGNQTTNLGSGRPYTCLQVQPATASTFTASSVILSSITMHRTDVPSTPISATGKTSIEGDKNGDGIIEISACFSKADLRVLFAGLPAGTSNVPVEIDGNLVDGSQFCAPYVMVVKSNGAILAATLSPNPFNPEAVLTFSTPKAGTAKVTMFDVSGRQVRSLMEESSLAAGNHSVRIDGRGDNGGKLASGVYFVKIETDVNGTTVMKAMIMK